MDNIWTNEMGEKHQNRTCINIFMPNNPESYSIHSCVNKAYGARCIVGLKHFFYPLSHYECLWKCLLEGIKAGSLTNCIFKGIFFNTNKHSFQLQYEDVLLFSVSLFYFTVMSVGFGWLVKQTKKEKKKKTNKMFNEAVYSRLAVCWNTVCFLDEWLVQKIWCMMFPMCYTEI